MLQIVLARLFLCLIFFTVAANAQNVNSTNLLKQLLDLPAPAQAAENAPNRVKPFYREPEFYDKAKVPPDDAPLADLIGYWSRQSRTYSALRYTPKPSEKTIARLLEFCEETPEFLSQFLNIFPTDPKIAETVKRLYDALVEKDPDDYGNNMIRRWLVYNSVFFVDELLKNAEKIKDQKEYVMDKEALLSLARIDWEKAVPILERFEANDKTQPVSAVLARWAYYAHAINADDELDISKYRRQLQAIVEDSSAPAGARDLAFDALVSEKDWDGRDDWYLSLLGDETLYELKVNGQIYTGLTTLLLYSPPEKYVQMMASLVEHKNPTIRRAAIKNLMTHLKTETQTEAVRALLPWLSNPNWASGFPNGRAELIYALSRVDLPETVPALITILMNEDDYRQVAAEALARYKDPRAVPALKTVLAAENVIFRRNTLIKALDASGGLTDDEKMAALETYAETISTPQMAQNLVNDLYRSYDEKTPNPVPVAVSIGNYVAEQLDPSDGLVMRAIERLKKLRKTKPEVAARLAQIMQKWRGRLIYIESLRQIRDGEADLDMILSTLAARKEVREKTEDEILALRTAGGISRGIAACLLEDRAEFDGILRQTDTAAIISALGCGRLLRIKLPVAEVGALLKNANKTVALAAERYLETEDSPEARTLVLAQHAGEAVILGARELFVSESKKYELGLALRKVLESVSGHGYLTFAFPVIDKKETALREEIKADPDLMAVYGILPEKSAGQKIIRVYKDKIVFADYEDDARYRERVLSAKEYEDFYRLVVDEKIDTTPNDSGHCAECDAGEFVMFGKNGGRRVYFTSTANPRLPVKKIVERIASFNNGDLKLRYRLADSVKGLEVLLADDQLKALAVWKNGGDLRVLIEDKEREAEIRKNLEAAFPVNNKEPMDVDEYERQQPVTEERLKRFKESRYAHYSWRRIENGKLGEISSQPPDVPYLLDETQFPETDGISPAPRAWKVRAGNYEIRVSDVYSDEVQGIYKASRSQAPQRFKKGKYDFPVVTGDGKWVIATKAENDWIDPLNIVRINLQTGKEFTVKVPPADTFKPIAFVASQNKVLLYRTKSLEIDNYRMDQDEADEEEEVEPSVPMPKDYKNPSPEAPEYYLLDAATGATAIVKGEFRPLEQTTYRPLQPVAAAPDEFWAALYDKKARETAIGRYNTKTFTIQPVARLPQISLDSMNIWVDEKESKIYFIYEGHLLSAPLK